MIQVTVYDDEQLQLYPLAEFASYEDADTWIEGIKKADDRASSFVLEPKARRVGFLG